MKKTFLLAPVLLASLAACSENAAAPAPETIAAEQPEPTAPADTGVAPGEPFSDLFLSWIEPADPFRVIGNVYFVGTTGLGDVEVSLDGNTVYTVDLGRRELVAIPIQANGAPGTPTRTAITASSLGVSTCPASAPRCAR